MSQHYILELQDKTTSALENFEKELAHLSKIQTREELQPLVDEANNLRKVLEELRKYFIEIRSKLANVEGIPPAKELAQIVIGAVTEALGAIRETLHHLEEYQVVFGSKRRKPKSLEELHYIDSSAKEAIRGTYRIIKRIEDHVEELGESK
jgi:hypothetical protein